MTLHETSPYGVQESTPFRSLLCDTEDLSVTLQPLCELDDVICKEPYFVPESSMQLMRDAIKSIEFVFSLPAFVQHSLTNSPDIAKFDSGLRGVFFGYDFHITPKFPKLIEINTNAGGALISSFLPTYLNEKLTVPQSSVFRENIGHHGEEFMEMFKEEWELFSAKKNLENIAIVDIEPERQFLKYEFQLFKNLFENHGISAFIVDPRDLTFNGDNIYFDSIPIDLIYNRMTDFYLSEAFNRHLKEAYLSSKVALTPNPRSHAIYANKQNLVYLSDEVLLNNLGVPIEHIITLSKVIPKAVNVCCENAIDLWENRKSYFFKPLNGYGGKAVYRGDKLTKSTWKHVIESNSYIAQQLIPPGEKPITHNYQLAYMKADVRNFVYNQKIQLTSARLYQGQTTNFRTPGGGFAVVVSSDDSKTREMNINKQEVARELISHRHLLTGMH